MFAKLIPLLFLNQQNFYVHEILENSQMCFTSPVLILRITKISVHYVLSTVTDTLVDTIA